MSKIVLLLVPVPRARCAAPTASLAESFLEAAGKIADGYPGIGAGYDSMVIAALASTPKQCAAILNEGPTLSSRHGSRRRKARSWTVNPLTR